MKIQDLISYGARSLSLSMGQQSPDESLGWLLQEAQLVDVRMDALTRRAGLILDLRVALQIRDANTGVLVVEDVEALSWVGARQAEPLVAWSIDGAGLHSRGGSLAISLGMWPTPGAELTIVGAAGILVEGNVPHLADAPPDYTETDRPGLQGLVAAWESAFTPLSASILG